MSGAVAVGAAWKQRQRQRGRHQRLREGRHDYQHGPDCHYGSAHISVLVRGSSAGRRPGHARRAGAAGQTEGSRLAVAGWGSDRTGWPGVGHRPGVPVGAPVWPLESVPAPDDLATLAPERDEPALPDEARAVAARASAAPTAPREAPAYGILNVRFTRGADTARIVQAMEELRAMLKERPGATRVVFHLPGPGGAMLPMEVRTGVAYDAELLAEVGRRVGEGLVRLELAVGSRP